LLQHDATDELNAKNNRSREELAIIRLFLQVSIKKKIKKLFTEF